MTVMPRALTSALLLAAGACSNGDATPTHSTPADAPRETRLTVPTGMVATVFATVPGARALLLGPDGAVYVSQPAAGQITRLVDTNSDGVAESQTVAVRGLRMPHGMAFHKGNFYVANTDGVVRVPLDAAGQATGAPVYLNHYGTGGQHFTRTIIFGADDKMYVSIGLQLQRLASKPIPLARPSCNLMKMDAMDASTPRST